MYQLSISYKQDEHIPNTNNNIKLIMMNLTTFSPKLFLTLTFPLPFIKGGNGGGDNHGVEYRESLSESMFITGFSLYFIFTSASFKSFSK